MAPRRWAEKLAPSESESPGAGWGSRSCPEAEQESVARLVALAEVPPVLRVDALAPAWTVAPHHRGVESQPGDHHESVAGVREHRDPSPLAGPSPVHEAARVERAPQQATAVKRVAHRAGAIVTAV